MEIENETEGIDNVILPYLEKLGFTKSQIKQERSFSIKLGKNAYEIKSGKEKETAAPRYDILVRSDDNQNLFIVEAKSPTINITDEDAEQGISYARLVHPIVPYVIVTNTRDTQSYDTYTKEKIDLDQLTLDRKLSIGDDLRYDALQIFLGLNVENVKSFSCLQQEEEMSAVKGTGKKYIPELFVERTAFDDSFDCFMEKETPVFVVTGEAGSGKTNLLCSLAERVGENHVTLFFNAARLYESLEETLKQTFDWNFREQLPVSHLVKKLDKLVEKAKCRIVIVVDALDEAMVTGFEQSLSGFVKNIRQFNGRIKLVVSIKASHWERFAYFGDLPSDLYESMDSVCSGKDVNAQEKSPFHLTNFNEYERQSAEKKYQEFFHRLSIQDSPLKKHCESPFLLRIVSEVYENSDEPLPYDLTEERVLDSWLEKKLAKMGDRKGKALRELKASGQILLEQPEPRGTSHDQIQESVLRNTLEVKHDSNVCEELVDQGILIQHEVNYEKFYTFYYSRFRDFFLAKYVLKLHELGAGDFKKIIDSGLGKSLLGDVLYWYLGVASAEHQKIYEQSVEGKALLFLEAYEHVLDMFFPALKKNFPPFSIGPLGIAYHTSKSWFQYAFFPLGNKYEERTYRIKSDINNSEGVHEEVWKVGSETKPGTFSLETDMPTRKIKSVLDRIESFVQNGQLNESYSVAVTIESLFSLATKHWKTLGLEKKEEDRYVSSPLNTKELEESISIYFGCEQYRQDWVNEQVLNRSSYITDYIEEKGRRSYSIHYDQSALADIQVRVRQQVADGKRFKAGVRSDLNEDLELMQSFLSSLPIGTEKIEPILPPPDLLAKRYYKPHGIEKLYSDELAEKTIQQFFVEGFKAYKEIVEGNFPLLLERFQFYQKLPCKIFLFYNKDETETDNSVPVEFIFIENDALVANEITVSYGYDEKVFIDRHDFTLHCGDKTYRIESIYTYWEGVFAPYECLGFDSEHLAPIRRFVYDLIRRDMSSWNMNEIAQYILDSISRKEYLENI